MGSSSSRQVRSDHLGQAREVQPRRKKESIFVPLLRSLSCGTTSSRRAERRVQRIPTLPVIHDIETVSCEKVPRTPFEICSREGKNLGHLSCDANEGSSTGSNHSGSLEHDKGSDKRRLLDGLSRVDSNNCSSSSSSSLVYFDNSRNNQQFNLTENGVHPVLRDRGRSSSFSEISGGNKIHPIGEDTLLANEPSPQYVGLSEHQGSSAGIPSLVGSQECEQHEILAAESYQRQMGTQASVMNSDDKPREATAFDNDDANLTAVPLLSEPVVGSTMVSHPTDIDLAVVNSEGDQSESMNSPHVEAVDLISQSSGESSSSLRGDQSGREARRNNRRRLWDAMTRVTSRRRATTPTIVVASGEDIDGLGSSSNSWSLFDLSGGTDGESMTGDRGFHVGRSLELEERRWRVRSQVWALQRLSSGIEGNSGRPRPCPSGLHPEGRCSCEAYVMTEETNTRASISRIVMLAEALFEVLDEIHRQSVALSRSTSLSLVSLPAPDFVVDSFPLRIHKKCEKPENMNEEAAQCHICLVDYEEGDRVRILPCNHDYHMTCVDKWLKEVHRVCPLCRGNVCEPHSGNTVSSAA